MTPSRFTSAGTTLDAAPGEVIQPAEPVRTRLKPGARAGQYGRPPPDLAAPAGAPATSSAGFGHRSGGGRRIAIDPGSSAFTRQEHFDSRSTGADLRHCSGRSELYWSVLGGAPDNERSIRRRTVMIELLHYCLAGYETGLIPEGCLRAEIFPGFFAYEENRDYWASIPHDLLEDSPSKKVRRFARIANEELQRARATGPGLTVPLPADHTPGMRLDREPRWHLPVLAMTVAAGLGFLLSNYRFFPKDRTLYPGRYGVVLRQATPRL